MANKFIDIQQSFNSILEYIEDIWLMSDILQIPPTSDREQLFMQFEKKYGGIFCGNLNERNKLGADLIQRVEKAKEVIGIKNQKRYKKIYVVKNLSEYINVLSEVRSYEGEKELWYRGQPDAKLQLVPNIYRNAKEIATGYGYAIKPRPISLFACGQSVAFPNLRRMLEKFKKNAKDLVKFEVNNDFEWMFLSQHYGMLTPLLDWSEDPLVGLFFSVGELNLNDNCNLDLELEEFNNFSRISEAAAVYILDPGKLNEH